MRFVIFAALAIVLSPVFAFAHPYHPAGAPYHPVGSPLYHEPVPASLAGDVPDGVTTVSGVTFFEQVPNYNQTIGADDEELMRQVVTLLRTKLSLLQQLELQERSLQ